ncbi:hypothetical protein C1H46_042414 [Malus baccata]|uniref:Uncharacterized protein n=1 Tax=Malus baccata TaxID=106549 RepID=A0A540KCU3_MALBA|nr:hypothetical protein C1H46_042414 [Malus baccata]
MRTSSKLFPAINHTSRSLVHCTSYHLSHPLHRSLHVVDTEEPPILRWRKWSRCDIWGTAGGALERVTCSAP